VDEAVLLGFRRCISRRSIGLNLSVRFVVIGPERREVDALMGETLDFLGFLLLFCGLCDRCIAHLPQEEGACEAL